MKQAVFSTVNQAETRQGHELISLTSFTELLEVVSEILSHPTAWSGCMLSGCQLP